jgi:hypothetical protein
MLQSRRPSPSIEGRTPAPVAGGKTESAYLQFGISKRENKAFKINAQSFTKHNNRKHGEPFGNPVRQAPAGYRSSPSSWGVSSPLNSKPPSEKKEEGGSR